MLTPEYLQRITEGAEEISSSLHRTIMDMIIERIMKRLGRGEDYLLTQTDRWQIQVLQESGELLEDIQKEIADKTKLQQKEIKDAFIDAGILQPDCLRLLFCNLRLCLESLKEITLRQPVNGTTLHGPQHWMHRGLSLIRWTMPTILYLLVLYRTHKRSEM